MKHLIHSFDSEFDFVNVWEIKTFLTSSFIHAFTTSVCYCIVSALIGMDTPFAILVNYKCSITELIIFNTCFIVAAIHNFPINESWACQDSLVPFVTI